MKTEEEYNKAIIELAIEKRLGKKYRLKTFIVGLVLGAFSFGVIVFVAMAIQHGFNP